MAKDKNWEKILRTAADVATGGTFSSVTGGESYVKDAKKHIKPKKIVKDVMGTATFGPAYNIYKMITKQKKEKGGIVNNKGGIEASLKRRREEERKQSKVSKYGDKGMITPNYKKGNRDPFTEQYD